MPQTDYKHYGLRLGPFPLRNAGRFSEIPHKCRRSFLPRGVRLVCSAGRCILMMCLGPANIISFLHFCNFCKLQTVDCWLLTADCKLIAGQQKGRNCSRVLTQRMATIAASLMSSKMRATMKSWPGSKPRPIPRWPTPLGIPHRPARHSHPLFAHLSHCTRVIKCNFIATIGGPYKKYVGCGF